MQGAPESGKSWKGTFQSQSEGQGKHRLFGLINRVVVYEIGSRTVCSEEH
jgi:hypothetical protein